LEGDADIRQALTRCDEAFANSKMVLDTSISRAKRGEFEVSRLDEELREAREEVRSVKDRLEESRRLEVTRCQERDGYKRRLEGADARLSDLMKELSAQTRELDKTALEVGRWRQEACESDRQQALSESNRRVVEERMIGLQRRLTQAESESREARSQASEARSREAEAAGEREVGFAELEVIQVKLQDEMSGREELRLEVEVLNVELEAGRSRVSLAEDSVRDASEEVKRVVTEAENTREKVTTITLTPTSSACFVNPEQF